MARSFSQIRRDVQRKPGFTRLPVCPHCLKEIPLLEYAKHTAECEKAPPPPAPAAQEPVSGANGAQPAPKVGLVYALFDKAAVARLERAGAEILRLRQELREKHNTLTPEQRSGRCRELARRSCNQMATVLEQLATRFDCLGSGGWALSQLREHVTADALRSARDEMIRLSDPAAWTPPAIR